MEALPAAPVLTPAPPENECYGITKPSYISKCRHLGVVPAGCLPATYHSPRAQHNILVPRCHSVPFHPAPTSEVIPELIYHVCFIPLDE